MLLVITEEEALATVECEVGVQVAFELALPPRGDGTAPLLRKNKVVNGRLILAGGAKRQGAI